MALLAGFLVLSSGDFGRLISRL